MSADGTLALIEDGDTFRCRCGTVKEGHKRGPRGGRQWKYRLRSGVEVCGQQCASLAAAVTEDQAIRVDDEMAGEREADHAQHDYFDARDGFD